MQTATAGSLRRYSSEGLQFLLRERIYWAEWWIRALDQLNLMVVFRVVWEAVEAHSQQLSGS
jgi:hypothetical protein